MESQKGHNGAESMFEEKMAKNSPKLMADIQPQI